MNFFIILLIFAIPLLAVSIYAARLTLSKIQSHFYIVVLATNIFLMSIGPLVISIILLMKSSLSLPLAAVTMAGFVPSVISFCIWYVLLRKAQKALKNLNAASLTFLNLIWPLVLAFVNNSKDHTALIGLFSYEFLSMTVGLTLLLFLNQFRVSLNLKMTLLAACLIGLFLIWPGITYEIKWLLENMKLNFQKQGFFSFVTLIARYLGIAYYSLYLFRKLKKLT